MVRRMFLKAIYGLIPVTIMCAGVVEAAKPLKVWGFGGPSLQSLPIEKAYWARAEKELGFPIEFVAQTDFQAYLSKLTVSTAAGVGPDVVTRIDYQFANQNLYADLSPFVKRDKFDMGRFVPSVVKHCTFGGKILAIPDGTAPAVLYYNKALFSQAGLPEPPHDWTDDSWNADAFIEYGKKIAKLSPDGRKFERVGVSGLQTEMYWPRMWGGDWTDASGKVTANSPAVIKAYDFIAKLISSGVMPGWGRAGMDFTTNKVGTMVEGVWMFTYWNNAIKNKFSWDIAPIPKGTDRATIGWFDASVIMKGSKLKENAWKLIKWMHKSQNAAEYFLGVRSYAPFGRELNDDFVANMKKSYPSLDSKMAVDAAHYGIFPELNKLRQGSNIQVLISASTGKFMSKSGIEPKQFADQLQKDILALLASRK